MERLDSFYSECLGTPVNKIKSGKIKIVSSERRLTREEGYGVIFPFLLLYSSNRCIISVRPDLIDLVSALIHDETDAKMLFNDAGGKIVESLCRSVIPKDFSSRLRSVYSLELFVDRDQFRQYNIPECRRLTKDDHELIDEMNEISDFTCPDECIKDGTAFGVFVDGKIVARSTTIHTPIATQKYNLVWIGVETLPEYRQKGYAKAVVSGTTDALLLRGQTPVYTHAVWNVASGRTAKALGYQLYGELLRWQY
ncbi:TPA: GNAT family N-acetyltransferase [bacterium]|nr:GNAT family N-acetyltransferase [bacterium]